MTTTESTATPQKLPISSPIELRAELVKSLRRRLFGPSDDDDSWRSQDAVKLIADGADFPDYERPVGPFRTANGNEVLHRLPRNFYHTGVLWGVGEPVPVEEILDEELDPESGESAEWRVSDTEGEADQDDVPDDIDNFGRRRSMSTSFRVPLSELSISVDFRFGIYRKISATFKGRSQNLWERATRIIHEDLPIALSSKTGRLTGEKTWDVDGLQLQLSWITRYEQGSCLVTIAITNITPHNGSRIWEPEIFQAQLVVTVPDLEPYANQNRLRDPVDLLYRDIKDLAVGHGTDVLVTPHLEGFQISTVAIPVVEVPAMTPDVSSDDGLSFAVAMDDLAAFNNDAVVAIQRLIDHYENWVAQRKREVLDLDPDLVPLGTINIESCSLFLEEMKAGFALATTNQEVRRCLQDASQAMSKQRIASSAELRPIVVEGDSWHATGTNPHLDPSTLRNQAQWRPFQIAFILASLPKVIDPNHLGRQNVDVIWMPTGGGKTEAYLGLAAFTILWERSQAILNGNKKDKSSTKVLMRYTLRLLTVQQFLRSASLICALELLRQDEPERYGQAEIRIGAWVGSSATPNKRKVAVDRLKQATKDGSDLGFLLTRCPWCSCQMSITASKEVLGYRVVAIPDQKEKRVLAYCPDRTCPFTYRTEMRGQKTFDRGIPVLEVDEDVYAYPPDFVIGTVDKIAMMWSQTDAQNIFGLRNGKRRMPPPALFIQDELHLITGPLGSLDGLYEVMLEELCQTDGGRSPLYVASTATTRQFVPQIQALYGRSGKLVPPPGLNAEDSFFSRRDIRQPSRMYVGICSSGGKSSGSLQVSVLGALAHYAPVLEEDIDKKTGTTIDPYWTNVCFFSSRAALGILTSLAETDLASELDEIRRASGSKSGSIKDDGSRSNRRYIFPPREITATSSERVGEVLEDLLIRHDSTDSRPVDLCFATSMIEVGLDVPRLGLMTIIGQPKLSSQYIQVSGRVGRSSRAPALVIDVLGTYNPRDRSHYEHFTSSHQRLYASVEGSSVTPFTVPALDRSAPSVAAILCRILGGAGSIPAAIGRYWPRLTEILLARATLVDGPRGHQNALKALDRLRIKANFPKVPSYEWSSLRYDNSFLFPFGNPLPPDRVDDVWQVLTSMRSVDPDAAGFVHSPTISAVAKSPSINRLDIEESDI